ncbi:hypothetical protein P5673_029386 [Acropora cervicornis]|uniref:N-acetyltransferase domain-containing protein n=1 Tax=Acropora cervicornis TaxID=6130 RepID=A0AAD9PWD2_ACRCE|nr:hypothetical protein P5673_029386 [Acropora cervicornis]
MAVNSISWQVPSKFRFYSKKPKRNVYVRPYLVEFKRLLESRITAIKGVSNHELLHTVVALYDSCLPEITPEVLYPTVCGKWAKTLILLRDFEDVLLEMKGLCPEETEELAQSRTDQTLARLTDDLSTPDLFNEQSHETLSLSPSTDTADLQEIKVSKEEEKLKKQVSWSDTKQTDDNLVSDNENSEDEDSLKTKNICNTCSSDILCCKSDSGVVLIEDEREDDKHVEKTRGEDKSNAKEKEIEPRKFDGVFSDTESEESAESEDEEEDFSKGAEDFVKAARQRRTERHDKVGIESIVIGAATFERSYSIARQRSSEKVIQLDLLAVRKRCRKSGIGKFLVETLKDPTIIGPYDTIAVYADNEAVDFFKRNGFTDDVVLCSRFSELTDNWINSTLMCYLPPFTGSDYSGAFRSEEDLKAMDEDIRKWREKSLEAYQAQTSCFLFLFTEKELVAYKMREKDGVLVDGDSEDDGDLYEALAEMLSKKHVTDSELDLDLEAISHGDFRDVPEEDEEFVSSFITSRSEKQLVQQLKRSLLSTKNYSDIVVNSVKKVESCHIAFMETGFDSRAQRLGDPVICTQLYFCGGASDEQIERIMKQGFSKKDFTRGPYGKGLYFSAQACQGAAFSEPGKLLLCNVGLGLTESVVVQDRGRSLPPPGYDSILTAGRTPSPVSSQASPQQEYVVFDPLQGGNFKATLNSKWIVKFEDMVENLTSRKAQVCDSRVPEKFQLSSDVFSDAGVDLSKPVIW